MECFFTDCMGFGLRTCDGYTFAARVLHMGLDTTYLTYKMLAVYS